MKRSVLAVVLMGSAVLTGCASGKQSINENSDSPGGAVSSTPTPNRRPEVNPDAARSQQTQHAGSDRTVPAGSGERP